MLFGAVVLVTGSIWGKAAWDVWWDWDARLTTSLLLWMTMVGYVLVRQYGGPGSERMAAGLAMAAGLLFVPGVTLAIFRVTGLGEVLWRLGWALPVAALVGVLGSERV